MSTTLERLSPWLFTVGMFVLWELVCRVFKVDTFVLPAPSQIFQAIGPYWLPLAKNSFVTLWTTLAGFALAVAFGIHARHHRRLVPHDLPRPLCRDDRLQLDPEGRRGADPDHLVRHWCGAGGAHRVSDLVLSDRGQRCDRACHHGAGARGRVARARRQETRHLAEGRHSAHAALSVRLA